MSADNSEDLIVDQSTNHAAAHSTEPSTRYRPELAVDDIPVFGETFVETTTEASSGNIVDDTAVRDELAENMTFTKDRDEAFDFAQEIMIRVIEKITS